MIILLNWNQDRIQIGNLNLTENSKKFGEKNNKSINLIINNLE